jgi:hypothetical protein
MDVMLITCTWSEFPLSSWASFRNWSRFKACKSLPKKQRTFIRLATVQTLVTLLKFMFEYKVLWLLWWSWWIPTLLLGDIVYYQNRNCWYICWNSSLCDINYPSSKRLHGKSFFHSNQTRVTYWIHLRCWTMGL